MRRYGSVPRRKLLRVSESLRQRPRERARGKLVRLGPGRAMGSTKAGTVELVDRRPKSSRK